MVGPETFLNRHDTTIGFKQKHFKIEKQIARYFVQYSEFPSNPSSFYATQIINPFLNLRISANHKGVVRILATAIMKSLCSTSVKSLGNI